MGNYSKAKNEFNKELKELKKETHPSIYAGDLKEIVLYQKLMELQVQINTIREKIDRN
jgi:hypothetical protein